MKNKAAKQKSKRKGSENAFGCDLTEHLQNSGQDVPHVLKACAEFIEEHGVVDGIYRHSGITSNIQRLRQEFGSECCPDLTKEVYLQDIHCVGSLCKLYFRELPNPLLTYELYKRFTDAVLVKEEHHEQLRYIQCVIKELPVAHFRTLEYLTKHLAHLATLSHQTNMHARNLALVWAPNLLRSKEIEVSTCNGDVAFQEVRVQQTVVEFILNHTDQIFNHGSEPPKPREGPGLACGEKYATLPATTQCGPMKLMSLEEAQARSLSPNHPARRERQRENSLPDTSTATLYHTVIDLSDSKRKFSGKSKKWKSIFSLGRSVTDSKGKLSRNGSVFMRAQNISEKPVIRPSKSMDSLCSLPTDDDKADKYTTAGGANGFFVPAVKSRTLGSDYDLSEPDPKWEFDLRKAGGASGGSPGVKRRVAANASSSSHASSPQPQKAVPEQLKVFKGDDLSGCQPTSPKNRRMLYSGSAHNSGSSRPSFPGNLFPLESSPRHQRKALNISEPFAVSVPLRVSAVISSNSTPCRAPGKERAAAAGTLKTCREAGPPDPHRSDSAGLRELVPSSGSTGHRDRERGLGGSTGHSDRERGLGGSSGHSDRERGLGGSSGHSDRERGLGGSTGSIGYREHPLGDSSGGSGYSIYSNSSSTPLEKEDSPTEEKSSEEATSNRMPESKDAEVKEVHSNAEVSVPQLQSLPKSYEESKERSQSPGKQLDNQPAQHLEPRNLTELDMESINKELWSDIHHELKIIEPDINILEDVFKPSDSLAKITSIDVELNAGAHAKRRSSLPTHPVSSKGLYTVPSKGLGADHFAAIVLNPALRHHPESWNFSDRVNIRKDCRSQDSAESLDGMANKLQLSPLFHLKETDILQDAEPWSVLPSCTEPKVDSAQQSQISKADHSGDISGNITTTVIRTHGLDKGKKEMPGKQDSQEKAKEVAHNDGKRDLTVKVMENIERISKCLDERRPTLELPHQDDEEICGGTSEGLDLVEPWEDFSTTKQWVTSPLHSPNIEDLFPKPEGSSSFPVGDSLTSTKLNITPSFEGNKVVTDKPGLANIVPSSKNNKVMTGEPGFVNIARSSKSNKVVTDEPGLAHVAPSSKSNKVVTDEPGLAHVAPSSKSNKVVNNEVDLAKTTEPFLGAGFQGSSKTETKGGNLQLVLCKTSIVHDEASRLPKRNSGAPKQKNDTSSQRFHRQVSHEPCHLEKNEENIIPKHRPYSLNLDLGHRCIRDISNRQNLESPELCSIQRVSAIPSGSKHVGFSLELEMFLSDRQAPMRRNSAPVSVSSVRTAFMIKTCQAKAVPVIPPKLQYSHIPHAVPESKSSNPETKGLEKEPTKNKVEKPDALLLPLQSVRDPKEELENQEPAPRMPKQASTDKPTETCKSTPTPDPPVLRRKRSSNGDTFVDCPRPDRSTLLQRPSFRNRPRPQSLILFSPPFPIMDYPPLGDDGKVLLSPIKSPTETSPLEELVENLKTPEGVTLRNKMTLPKSGQRLETSTSCFYQPQRRSMIFDSRSNRQIE